jgi:hypothetical protein
MSNNTLERSKTQDEPSRTQKVLEWAMCHPGVLLLSSVAVGAMLAWRREGGPQAIPDRRVETEADIVDGDVPLFI